MKKNSLITLLLTLTLSFVLLFTLTSCGKMLIGTYTAQTLNGDVTYEFEIGGKVTKTTNPYLGKGTTVEGKYEFIQEDTKITLTFPDDDPVTYDFSSGEEDGVEYIKLDGWKYIKQ